MLYTLDKTKEVMLMLMVMVLFLKIFLSGCRTS